MYYLYILYSASADKFYVGYSDNPQRRLLEHNSKVVDTYTSKHRPWVLKAVFECGSTEKEALRMEGLLRNRRAKSF